MTRLTHDGSAGQGSPSAIPSTTHRLTTGDAGDLKAVATEGVHLVITSPPYPMVEMWDATFAAQDSGTRSALESGDGAAAFEAMHRRLDRAWAECARVLVPGGFACVNVGDATRTIGGDFRLWSNHSRIIKAFSDLGMTVLPDVLWRKPTNAPNKFMGSGMLPAGAYVTYEHEYVLVFRKGGKREFGDEAARERRRRSAYFFEERNVWFSDLWTDLRGKRQEMGGATSRDRSGAFPFELPWRLIHMYSLQGDTVLDPFVGTGTTCLAAACAARHSVGIERDSEVLESARAGFRDVVDLGTGHARARLARHATFVSDRRAQGKSLLHRNGVHGFEVVTSQERDLVVTEPIDVSRQSDGVIGLGHRVAGSVPTTLEEQDQLPFVLDA